MSNGQDYFGRGPTLETAIDALERFQSAFGVESPVGIDWKGSQNITLLSPTHCRTPPAAPRAAALLICALPLLRRAIPTAYPVSRAS